MKHIALLRCAALALHFPAVAVSAVTTHFALDTRVLPLRTPAASETIPYNPAWGGGSSVTLALDGETIGTYSAAGTRTLDTTGWSWGRHTLTHTSGSEMLAMEYEKPFPFPPPEVTNLSVQQRYPWNGLVDIMCDVACADADAALRVSIAATVTATDETLPVRTVTQPDGAANTEVGAGPRHLVWDAGTDVPNRKFEDVTYEVTAELLGGVQLWEDGPYWAECNVGASQPEDYGTYFWWGDTVGYKRNADDTGWVSVADVSSFSFSSGNCPTHNKNTSDLRSAGYIDATGNLVAAHDAATAHLGAPWRIPTDAEWAALIDNCDTTWITRNGVNGRLVTGRGAYASKSIFLPAAGYGYGSGLRDLGSYGYYWSSTPYSDDSSSAWYLYFHSGRFRRYANDRCYGQSVRPLRGFAE